MEGETGASINTQMTFFNERVLPSLEKNIKSGNSLIGLDFYDTEFDFGEDRKVKPFSWEQQFAEVFKNGGFDVVIGNPPYVMSEINAVEKNYLSIKYNLQEGKPDLYRYFIEKSYKILNSEGNFSFIIPALYYQFLLQLN